MRPRRRWANQQFVQVEPTTVVGRRHRPDYVLLVLSAILLTVGLVVVYSISPGLASVQHQSQSYFVIKQLLDVGLGIVAFCLAVYLPIRRLPQLANPLLILAAIGSLVVMITPLSDVYPAHRWIKLGSFSFQIAELIKLALIVWLAAFLARLRRSGELSNQRRTLQPLLIILLIVGLVVAKLQSDLGSAAVIIAILVALAYNVGIPLKRLALISVAVAGVVVLAVASSGYRRERLAAYLHPGSDCRGSGYQACQALITVGSGGVFGLGLGNSVQAYGYLPEASNDSIFAIIAEKFGFIGSTLIVCLYAVLITRIMRLVERTADVFQRLVVVGVLAWLSTQMIINVGAMLGLLPLKGITLPLISQGGTSMVFLAAALGIVFQISRYTSYDVTQPQNRPGGGPSDQNSPNGRRLGRPYNPSLAARPRLED